MFKKDLNTNKKEEQGITLVALVITIIILIILATVTINMAFGDNGLIRQAELARDLTANSTKYEEASTANLVAYMNEVMREDAEISVPDTRSEIEKARDEGTIFATQTELSDSKGNIVTVPEGFKIAEDSGITVQEGVVIEDVSASTDTAVQGSQYVWIPVGSFVNDNGETKEVTLGRYTFADDANGTPTLVQDAANYTDQSDGVVINDYYKELINYREGVASNGVDGENATAKDLEGFLNSARDNGGYYIGRYEASYASGATSTTTIDNYENCKAASKISTAYRTSTDGSMSYSEGTLWNFITQLDASKVAINTYAGSSSVTSDLMNSYAWDTAIVYIQQAGNINYANQDGYSINSNLANTGANGDEVCKINDMASNLNEWNTEYTSLIYNNSAYSCVGRGDNCSSHGSTAGRGNVYATGSNVLIGFRINLYL